MISIIYAHPLKDSLNASILKAVGEKFNNKGLEYSVLDLYQDGFDPVFKPEEQTGYFTGEGTHDPLVKKYQESLAASSQLVFIFPIWWNEQPAIVKGFIERVCLPGFGFKYTEQGVAPLLTNIKEVTVLTTSGAPDHALKNYCGNIIENQFINNIIRPITGLNTAKWMNLGLASSSPEQIKEHIASVSDLFEIER
ncbi:NAD(P)H dehydrogenase (quinone) [Syntrophobotulus glycolicus DSM 8271]|uniref:NAD(P)H dehydrogenase (Quinone) n=1 Tax=Syntrophobotulus glycolicus (strain DSM 8271 / FlGlyR) TaxID=645991 RepID=F0SV69_SYNGF|nr:NAD(P)H-dependent oxidoreductase [Syntrophobotulus glycolicus]ADY55569.1 NAD(P)H dehydrogenase (quinone) [Syntrophobotulus glycolicus DSM 8271]